MGQFQDNNVADRRPLLFQALISDRKSDEHSARNSYPTRSFGLERIDRINRLSESELSCPEHQFVN
ncbi:MAG: hypothetical protein DWQ34_12305 [Planctomycetota bacterium]|nr:MAG: hypothetical protein DWQ34_12305 [Planctomycetota bacterium]REK24885.1 MAG: hypothetical protein DWQ41_13200 [Planctomycetota bacterium]